MDPKLKSLRVVHLAMAGFLILVTLAVYSYLSNDLQKSGASYAMLNIITPFVMLTVALVAQQLGKRRVEHVKALRGDEQIEAYRKLQIMQYAILEFCWLLALISFIITKELNYIIYACFMIIYLLYIRPNDFKLKKDLDLE